MIAFLLAAAATAADNPLHTFKDWIVGCDNGRSCMAVGQFPENDFTAFTIAVERGPLPDDQPVIWFRDDGESNPVDFAAGGKPIGIKFVTWKEFDIAVAPASTAAALAAILSPAKVTTIVKPGKDSYTVSTNGAAAALRWMDVAQHRDGTVTALVAKGARPASAVPPPPALPAVIRRMPAMLPPPDSLSAADVSKWRQQEFECEDEDPNPEMVESKRLDARTTLVMITASCASGAYNYAYIPVLVRKGEQPVLAKFEDLDSSEMSQDLYNLYWGGEGKDDRVLGSYFKGRGLGDCGGGTDWVWDGAMFRAVGQSSMDDCRGAPGWITTFKARIVDQ